MSSTTTAHPLLEARPRPGALLDVAIAAAALVGSLALVSGGGTNISRHGSGDLDLLGVAMVAGATVPLVAWRRSPWGVFVLTATVSVLLAALSYPIGLTLGPAAALYLLAASRDEARPWTQRDTGLVVWLFFAFLGATGVAESRFPAVELIHAGLAWAVAWFAGDRSRLRREHVAELQERAESAERDAERERLLAAAEERARIARDLHDSAGHAINVIAVRAGAARLRHGQRPDRSLLALEAIEDVARQTAGEIDQIVGTLRDGVEADGPVEAPPGLASLDTLIAHHAATGLDVTLNTTGERRRLGGPPDQAAYRILQEALTNAARHGAGRASVEVEFGDACLAVTITNPVPPESSLAATGGHGLVGMHERTTLLGGKLETARSNGTFRVRAHLPYGGRRA